MPLGVSTITSKYSCQRMNCTSKMSAARVKRMSNIPPCPESSMFCTSKSVSQKSFATRNPSKRNSFEKILRPIHRQCLYGDQVAELVFATRLPGCRELSLRAMTFPDTVVATKSRNEGCSTFQASLTIHEASSPVAAMVKKNQHLLPFILRCGGFQRLIKFHPSEKKVVIS